jgi:hypothetical protein
MHTLGYITTAALVVAAAAAGLVVVSALPDMRRYVKIKRM